MKTADLNTLELIDAWYENDPTMHVRVTFPFNAATANETSSVVYFEIEPGRYLGTHTDSAEEIILILAGTVEASLGEEKGRLSTGQDVLIPRLVDNHEGFDRRGFARLHSLNLPANESNAHDTRALGFEHQPR